jgi:hypothetical protein
MLAGRAAPSEDVMKNICARPTAKEVISKRSGDELCPAVSVPVISIDHPEEVPDSGGRLRGETVHTTELAGTCACKLADQKRATHCCAFAPASTERIRATSALTWAALVWNETASAICQGPPRGLVVVACDQATAVTLPRLGVMAAVTASRSALQARLAASQARTREGVSRTDPSP